LGEMIGIWAPYQRTGRTTITIALAYKISEKLSADKKVLVCCTNGYKGTLLKAMNVSIEEIGLEDLVSYKLAGFSGEGYGTILARRGRMFFAGSSKMTPHFVKTHMAIYKKIFDDLKSQFDIVIIDLPDGQENVLGNMLMGKCDRVITVAEQDIDTLTEKQLSIKPQVGSFLIINKYKKLYPLKSDIKNLCHLKAKIYHVPDCNIFREMKNKGRLLQYLTLQTDFNLEIDNIVTNFLEIKQSTILDGMHIGARNRRIFDKLKINMLGGEQR